ncbi:uncharacterized protein BDR25DRAFT_345993 [Lindgomyces ingoldianus]|uniref:Uncharacterized protein n=1 Tax=Lindgomyces ingoldianus TaxID=673940 RepID=A0ACB6QEK8_9PLEO|nr:uncharacterized protein BDR25DRAFT_345993 [Lindgomyces ingoldianus]KAF2465418.1 hypothetical protein BDR25DRAFT_345993 [Lindgomyces ingoldianus]
MSTPNSRRSGRGTTQTPPASNPPQSATHPNSAPFMEAKSEYLRSALEARRAKDAPVPPPTDHQPPPRPASAASTVDPWLSNVEFEEEIPKVPPIRRTRRPSEGVGPRIPTYRDMQADMEKRENILLDMNLKLELLRKQNNELKDKLEAADKRIYELEALEEENRELREDCNHLELKLQDMDELEEENAQLQEQNTETLKIQEETVAEMEKLNTAMDEAADMIFRLDTENSQLKKENSDLKLLVARNRSSSEEPVYYSADGEGSPPQGYPTRVYSIDEARPSTSNFDSDYYSQPASPQVKPTKEAKQFSEHAKKFQELNQNGQYAIQELRKRASEVSITSRRRSASPVPEVPQIPENFAKISESKRESKLVKRTPGRHRSQGNEPAPVRAVQENPSRPGTSTPRTPTSAKGGLRELFHSGHSLSGSRPTSSYKSPTAFKASRTPDAQPSSLFAPPRHSSRFAPTSSSAEQLRIETDSSEWAEIPPPPSVISEDLTTEIDPREEWWKRDKRLEHPGARSLFAPSPLVGSRAMPASLGTDFLFNATEGEDEFIKRTQNHLSRKR